MHNYHASSNWTGRAPRTSREAFGLSPGESSGIEYHKAPISRRFFYAVMRWGWVVVPAVLLALVLTGCDDIDMHIAVQADLADAIATAAKEAGNVEVAAK